MLTRFHLNMAAIGTGLLLVCATPLPANAGERDHGWRDLARTFHIVLGQPHRAERRAYFTRLDELETRRTRLLGRAHRSLDDGDFSKAQQILTKLTRVDEKLQNHRQAGRHWRRDHRRHH